MRKYRLFLPNLKKRITPEMMIGMLNIKALTVMILEIHSIWIMRLQHGPLINVFMEKHLPFIKPLITRFAVSHANERWIVTQYIYHRCNPFRHSSRLFQYQPHFIAESSVMQKNKQQRESIYSASTLVNKIHGQEPSFGPSACVFSPSDIWKNLAFWSTSMRLGTIIPLVIANDSRYGTTPVSPCRQNGGHFVYANTGNSIFVISF